MIAMRHQMTDLPVQQAAQSATPFALPDAPLSMPMQVIEREDGFVHRMLTSLRSGVPAQGN